MWDCLSWLKEINMIRSQETRSHFGLISPWEGHYLVTRPWERPAVYISLTSCLCLWNHPDVKLPRAWFLFRSLASYSSLRRAVVHGRSASKSLKTYNHCKLMTQDQYWLQIKLWGFRRVAFTNYDENSLLIDINATCAYAPAHYAVPANDERINFLLRVSSDFLVTQSHIPSH